MESRRIHRIRRHSRVRSRVRGTPERPRLAVFRSLMHIAAQVIDDTAGRTLAAASDRDVSKKGRATVAVAHEVGKLLAERARAAKVTRAVFDRGGHQYHGQVKALADGARAAGLEF